MLCAQTIMPLMVSSWWNYKGRIRRFGLDGRKGMSLGWALRLQLGGVLAPPPPSPGDLLRKNKVAS